MCCKTIVPKIQLIPIDRKFIGHGENDGFVLYGYTIKQCSNFCKYTDISIEDKGLKKIICQQ